MTEKGAVNPVKLIDRFFQRTNRTNDLVFIGKEPHKVTFRHGGLMLLFRSSLSFRSWKLTADA